MLVVRIVFAVLFLSSMSASAATYLTTVGNGVTRTNTIFRSNVNPTFDFQTDGTGATISSITFKMNNSSNASFGYPDSIATNVELKILNGSTVIDTFTHSSYDAGTDTVTLAGSANLAPNTTYTLKLGCSSCANTGFDQTTTNSSTGWQFTSDYYSTGYPIVAFDGVPDITAPTLSSSSPADNATSVAINSNIVLNFSEAVDAEAGNITLKKTSDNSTVEVFDVTSDLSGSGTTQITINPSSDLDGSTEYYVLIDGSAFDDASSNSYAGISSTTALSFTTVDTVAPSVTITAAEVSDGGSSADTSLSLTFTLSEADASSGAGEFTSSDITVTNGTISSFNSVSSTVYTATFTPTAAGAATIDVASGAFTDAASNNNTAATQFNWTYVTQTDPLQKADVIESSEISAISAINFTQTSVRLVNNRMSWLRNNATTHKTSRQGIKVSFADPLVEQYVNGTQSGIKALAFDEASAATALTQLASNADVASSSLKNKPVEVVMAEMKDIFGGINLNPTAEPLFGDWSLWTEGQITVGKTDTQETDSYSLALGVDRPYGDLGLIGVSLSVGQDDSDVGSSGSNVKSDNLSLSFYNAKELPNKLGLETQFGLGAMSIDTIRVDGAQTLTGKRDAKLLFGSVALRDEPLVYGDATLTPYGRAEWAYVELDPYDESGGSFALHYDKQHINRYMLILGSDVQYEAKYANGKLKPFAAFEYGLDLTRDSDVGMNYVSSSTSYTTKLEKAATSNLMLRLGADYLGKDDVRTSFSYERNEALGSGFSNTIKMQVNIPIQ